MAVSAFPKTGRHRNRVHPALFLSPSEQSGAGYMTMLEPHPAWLEELYLVIP